MSDNLFLFISFVIMWLMIFGVSLFYFGLVAHKNRFHTLFFTLISMLITITIWLVAGYSLAFSGNYLIIGDLSNSVLAFNIFNQSSQQVDSLFSMIFQLAFCMYAVIMLIGSVVERVNWHYFIFFLPLWILGVYAPLARWLWHDQGWLKQLGVLDFSGAIVVHLSAGVSSLVLAKLVGPRRSSHLAKEPNNLLLMFLGTIFICLGWFGFNTGPIGGINEVTGLVMINTLCALIGGSLGWLNCEKILKGKVSLSGLLNGLIVGLVSSTSAVAYVTPLAMFLITYLASIGCQLSINWINRRKFIDDPVDSFGINAVGGLIGTIGTGILATLTVNREGANGLLYGDPELLGKQLLAISCGMLLSIVMTYILAKFVCLFLPIRTSLSEEESGLDQQILI